MNINATLFGEIIIIFVIIIFAIVIGNLSYSLGKRKTNRPKIIAIVGILLSLIPPLALIYLAILALKKDIKPDTTNPIAG